MKNDYFKELIGQKISSVTFVMDYLQIDFDGNRLTLNVWPTLNYVDKTINVKDNGYRDGLCGLIAQNVCDTECIKDKHLKITLDSDTYIYVSLDPTNPDILTPEILHYSNTQGDWFVL